MFSLKIDLDNYDSKKLHLKLWNSLKEYYSDKGFMFKKKEWNVYNDKVEIPFFKMSSHTYCYTIEPRFYVKINNLIEEINNIIGRQILTNGIFIADSDLANFFGVNDFDKVQENNFDENSGLWRWRIFREEDVDYAVKSHISYMEKVGWKFISKFENENSIYDFYNAIFRRYLSDDDPNLNMFERSQPLEDAAHTTMIYLGMKNRREDIDELIELTFSLYGKGTLYTNPIVDFKNYFSNQV